MPLLRHVLSFGCSCVFVSLHGSKSSHLKPVDGSKPVPLSIDSNLQKMSETTDSFEKQFVNMEVQKFQKIQKMLPLGNVQFKDLSPLPEADTGGVTVIESSTLIAETDSSKTNSALQPEDATTRACSIQYETSISLLGDLHCFSVANGQRLKSLEAASSKTNNGSQTEDIQKLDDESTTPVTLRNNIGECSTHDLPSNDETASDSAVENGNDGKDAKEDQLKEATTILQKRVFKAFSAATRWYVVVIYNATNQMS
ncbi:hypothetical protein F2Q68_00013756 [Brassica cretica]|uniref:Uncharacterized protein n=1 Tax=Brassica cretica TaxID=69181 RepID=A0A8S9HGJ5_BRACR|nr:hypothetical protein F2Q68_00013756 [Brassica cretica]